MAELKKRRPSVRGRVVEHDGERQTGGIISVNNGIDSGNVSLRADTNPRWVQLIANNGRDVCQPVFPAFSSPAKLCEGDAVAVKRRWVRVHAAGEPADSHQTCCLNCRIRIWLHNLKVAAAVTRRKPIGREGILSDELANPR